MPTWQCTASCKNCGTFSNPRVKTRLDLEDILAAIDRARDAGFGLVVFTGGEATLRWVELLKSIQHTTDLGLPTRLVTNAWWANTNANTYRHLDNLKLAGLGEINFSTGDEHSKFVPIQNIVRAIRCSVDLGFEPHVMIEVTSDALVTKTSFLESPEFKECMRGLEDKVSFTESPWMPIDPNEFTSYPPGMVANSKNLGQRTGCDSVFGTHTLQANGTVAICCGLGMQNVKALQLGKFDRFTTKFESLAATAESDLVKLLIRQLGPEKLLARVEKLDPSIKWEHLYAHKCQACIRVFSDRQVLEVIRTNEDQLFSELAASIALDRLIAQEVR